MKKGICCFVMLLLLCGCAIPVNQSTAQTPTQEPVTTQFSTEVPTQEPTQAPTEAPTQEPTQAPTEAPTQAPALVKKGSVGVQSVSELSMYDVVTFGRYTQGALGSESPIEWYVVQKEGNRAMLLSKYALDSKRYHDNNTKLAWEGSDLYKWLNHQFKESAFTEQETELLTAPVTLLSFSQANELPKTILVCASTDYAVSNGGDQNRCIWWLSDYSGAVEYWDGTISHNASAVTEDGTVAREGYQVNFNSKFVRPVIIVEL
ncbi:MAG: PT domain-containing protein [Clostridia bacterium]|nr:PT domain-containing protein [Clostridia bacterium]